MDFELAVIPMELPLFLCDLCKRFFLKMQLCNAKKCRRSVCSIDFCKCENLVVQLMRRPKCLKVLQEFTRTLMYSI
jgi:hypothetical protein